MDPYIDIFHFSPSLSFPFSLSSLDLMGPNFFETDIFKVGYVIHAFVLLFRRSINSEIIFFRFSGEISVTEGLVKQAQQFHNYAFTKVRWSFLSAYFAFV